MVFAVYKHLAKDKFRCIIDTKNIDCFVTEILGSCFKLDKERKSFITGFHKKQRNKMRITVNEENVVRKIAIGIEKRTADVAVYVIK